MISVCHSDDMTIFLFRDIWHTDSAGARRFFRSELAMRNQVARLIDPIPFMPGYDRDNTQWL